MPEHEDKQAPLRGLYDFIRASQDEIIVEWSARVRMLSPAKELSRRALVDHLPQILARIADMVESVHTGGQGPLAEGPKMHALDRLARGFDLEEVIKEYSLLRPGGSLVFSCRPRKRLLHNYRDTTFADRAAMAIENARLFREAERAIRLREQVLAVVSHDLRNPLGPGIPESDLPHILDPYWSAKRHAKGMGLGLYISKGIIEAHGGRIWAERDAGAGATFHFTLPLAGRVTGSHRS